MTVAMAVGEKGGDRDGDYDRVVRFRDTDAAGVVYFGAVLDVCHEAYEHSIAMAGIDRRSFFSRQGYGVPITRAEVEFLRPLFCGDRLAVALRSRRTRTDAFEVTYEIFVEGCPDRPAGRARTCHVCIDGTTRSRRPLPPELETWLGQTMGDPPGDLPAP